MSVRPQSPAPAGSIADALADVEVSAPQALADGFRPYERFEVRVDGIVQRRDILRVGGVVGVLAFDPATDCLVLIRQFRLAAHLATGKGDLVELVAGRIDEGETAEQAARRECAEEIGVAPSALLPILSFMPTPGVTDEHATLYLGLVDSGLVPAAAGSVHETEHTRPFTIGVDAALAALDAGAPGNVFLLAALQWFALNRSRVATFVEGHA